MDKYVDKGKLDVDNLCMDVDRYGWIWMDRNNAYAERRGVEKNSMTGNKAK